MKKYRNEWKYCCTDKELLHIEERTKGILAADPHSPEGKYRIRSLYFDDSHYTCAHDTETGIAERYKYRIRYYNDFNGKMKLERKEKKFGRCHKSSCTITEREYNDIIEGRLDTLFWNTDNKVLKQFCIDIWKRGFKPVVIIDYERTAYIEEVTNIRITFDRNISASEETENFLTGDYLTTPIIGNRRHILEVKFDAILPSYVKKVVYADSLQQTSFSKYYIGLKRLKG